MKKIIYTAIIDELSGVPHLLLVDISPSGLINQVFEYVKTEWNVPKGFMKPETDQMTIYDNNDIGDIPVNREDAVSYFFAWNDENIWLNKKNFEVDIHIHTPLSIDDEE